MSKAVALVTGAVILALVAIATLVMVWVELSRMDTSMVKVEKEYEDENKSLRGQLSVLGAKLDRISQPKCQARLITPVKFQAKRGTCWDFTTLGILEQTYRRQGVENGWLTDLEYVRFSEHAYGVSVIEYCRNNSAHCPHVHTAANSTDGGFISWIYFFEPLQKTLVPNSVCPYVEEATNDHECTKYHSYLSVNPLKFKISNMRTMYDVNLIKERMRQNQNAMAWVSILGTVSYYVPCLGSFANTTACNATKCTLCPLDLNYPTKCCVKESRPGWSLDGEFYMHREMEEVGAHAMTLVGYNDNFVAATGHRGGFIVKNSWGAWHSHTVQYFMNEISHLNEQQVCPNSRNPRNWEVGQTILVCADTHYCDENVLYHLHSIESGPDDTVIMCFQRQEGVSSLNAIDGELFEAPAGKSDECSPPMPLDLYADFFEPIADQIEPNDEDSCGYFFFPYAVVDEISRKFGFFWVSDFDITWDEQSYTANKKKFPSLDYSEIEASTQKVFIPSYADALPFFPPEDGDLDLHHSKLLKLTQLRGGRTAKDRAKASISRALAPTAQ